MDRIIDVFGKRKKCESFVLLYYFVMYWVKKTGSTTLIVF